MGEQNDIDQLPQLVTGVDLRSLPIGPEEAFVLSRIDGRAKVRDLALTTGLSRTRVLDILARLSSLGAVSGVAGALNGVSNPASGRSAAQGRGPDHHVEHGIDLSVQQQRDIRTLHEMLPTTSHYDLLGVSQQASQEEIKAAYFGIVGRYHPDRYFRKQLGSFELRLEEIFARLTVASDTLGNSELRRAYDATLGPGGGPPPRRNMTPQPGAAANEPLAHPSPPPRDARAAPSSPRHPASKPTPQRVSKADAPSSKRMAANSPADAAAPRKARPAATPVQTASRSTTGTSGGRRILVKGPAPAVDASPAPGAPPPRPSSPPPNAAGLHADGVARARSRDSGAPRRQSRSSAPVRAPITSNPPSVGRRTALARKLGGSSVVPPARDSSRPSAFPSVRPGRGGTTPAVPTFPKAPRAPRISEAPPSGRGTAPRQDSGGSAAKALDLVRSLRPNDPKIVERLASNVAAARLNELGAEAQRRESSGRYYDAAMLYARASELQLDVRLLEGAARCLLRANRDLRQAAEYAKRAVDLAPKQIRPALLLCRIYVAADMKKSALGQLQKVLDREPNNEEAQTLLAELSRSKE